MKASEFFDKASKGAYDNLHENGVYHAFIAKHSANLRNWTRGQIHTPEYEAILGDSDDHKSATLLSATEKGFIKHVIDLR
jgi:hypothetical protein